MKNLLIEIREFQSSEINDEYFDKIVGDLLPGASIKVNWFEREHPDEGYVFVLPHQDIEECDACVHIPQMNNSDGIGYGDPVFCHISKILSNERVVSVQLTGGIL